MTAQDIAKLGKLLARFLIQFADCFARPGGGNVLEWHDGCKSRPPLKAAPLREAADFFTSKCMAPYAACPV